MTSESEAFPLVARTVKTADELRQCFNIRFNVYTEVGYLSRSPTVRTDLETDSYDENSIHFIAISTVDGLYEAAGTARLIFCNNAQSLFGRSVLNLLDLHRSFLDSLAIKASNDYIPKFGTFPVCATFGEQEMTRHSDSDLKGDCELSRLAVMRKHRMKGVARELIEMCITFLETIRAERSFGGSMFIECNPNHQLMYEKYGFRRIWQLPTRNAWPLNTAAIAMKRHLP